MYLARLLPAMLLFCSLPAFTQDQPPKSSRLPGNLCLCWEDHLRSYLVASPDMLSEPWRIIPEKPRIAHSGQDVMDRCSLTNSLSGLVARGSYNSDDSGTKHPRNPRFRALSFPRPAH
jgi:hypothetical protein